MELYYIWIIIGIALLIGEVFTLDFSLACFGLGALGAAAAAYLGADFTWQVATFSLACLFFFFTVRKFFIKYVRRTVPKVHDNANALIGRTAIVSTKIDSSGLGRVKVDGDDWRAESDKEFEVGVSVKIIKLDGATLTVEELK